MFIFAENQVDEGIFGELSESDFKQMFSAVGTKRKMILLQNVSKGLANCVIIVRTKRSRSQLWWYNSGNLSKSGF